ncbi:MAG: acetate--CoA ligase family protein [Pseudomonadales bacterium]|jgi:acetyl coenzyme A synthetase (ADP forming)-like protein|nr:acetate--CoA ligase family protein [Pseudomonadales bacterium]MDP7314839.1 acetate--CoA ligase family protein [Pseudomonadales bacterium]|tara:strand:+ start:5087 stop:7216 length:2130 start_codon:yes stop_codon:yes gene_type:complete
MSRDQQAVRTILEAVKSEGRSSLSSDEARELCQAYDIPTPGQGLATSADDAVSLSDSVGYPVVLKIESPDILHKTDAGGVIAGLTTADEVRDAFEEISANAKAYNASASISGVQVQQMLPAATEVIVGAVTDPTFGKLTAFGLGGTLVEVLGDMTFRLAPTPADQAMSMLDDISGAEVLAGIRGAAPVDRSALASIVENVGALVGDFPEIDELDLNPVMASSEGATAVDVRILTDFNPKPARFRPSHDDILSAMQRVMQPDGVAVIGASAEDGKIGNSVMKNLIDGGYEGEIYPIHPREEEILGRKCHASVTDVSGNIDIAIFCIPARFVAGVLAEVGQKGIAGAILIPSGFAEVGEHELQEEVVQAARDNNVRLMGPNIYGFYYTHKNLCATFCTPYDEKGSVALSSQSGGVGMAIIGFSRSAKMGVSAIVGLGNKSDIDEDDLLVYFEQDPNTEVIAMHVEDLKDGQAFAEVATRVSKTKPVVVLKAGRTSIGAKAANSHTGALAGDDRVYDSILKQSGVIRARSLNDLLEYARGLSVLPTPKGENILILTGAGGSGVLLSDACVDNDLTLMSMPDDLDAAFKEFIPPFGASGNPVDITGGEPPTTYRATIELALNDERIHSLVLGYWHTIITPPMVFAELLSEEVEAARNKGINKPVVVSLVGDVEVEEACRYLLDRDILAYPYTAEKPVAVLGAKYRWARSAGLL